jgi:hypothetical protein
VRYVPRGSLYSPVAISVIVLTTRIPPPRPAGRPLSVMNASPAAFFAHAGRPLRAFCFEEARHVLKRVFSLASSRRPAALLAFSKAIPLRRVSLECLPKLTLSRMAKAG